MRPDERASAFLLPHMYRFMKRPYVAQLEELSRSETLPPEELSRLQFGRLTSLLAHAYEHVPYYRTMFDELGARPEDIRTLADYAKLPMLDKSTVRESGPSLVATDHPIQGMAEVWTSGSTATPVRVYHDPDYFDRGWATLLRNMAWTGHTQGERQVWLTRETTGGLKRSTRLALERKWVAGKVVQSPETIAMWAAELQRRRPRLVYSTPSSRLSAMSEYLIANNIELDSVRAVMTTSETLLEPTRALIEKAFGAQVFDQYGSNECLSIASECAAGSMHVNAEINLVEYVPLDSSPGASEMVITPLFNFGMPLLRYRLGDLGAPVAGICECGRTLPRMRMLAGRLASTVRLADGTVITPFALEELVHEVDGIVRFQFRQVEADVFDLLIIATASDAGAVLDALRDIDDVFEKHTGLRPHFRVQLVDDIALTAAGKHLYVVPLKEETPR